jgi:hypothetical protein
MSDVPTGPSASDGFRVAAGVRTSSNAFRWCTGTSPWKHDTKCTLYYVMMNVQEMRETESPIESR